MQPKFPEKNKKPGLYYAVTDDGLELPVIDITHPSFSLYPGPQELAALTEAYYQQSLKNEKRSLLRNLFMWFASRKSRLMRGLFAIGKTGFLDPITTYLLKLGPGHLGKGYASKIDFMISASLPCQSVRLRLRDVATLLSGGLAPLLAQRPGEPLRLLNIGGGTCVDSWNALLLLRKNHPETLQGRPLHLYSLDLGETGYNFGARAFAALRQAGGPLAGLDLSLHHLAYDWRDTSTLVQLLKDFGGGDVVAASSEGALLEYGTDAEITANLGALGEAGPKDLFLVGSVTKDHEAIRASHRRFNLKPRKPEVFRKLAAGAGWSVERTLDAILCDNVFLKPN